MTNHIFDMFNPTSFWVENAWDRYKKLHDSFGPKIIPLTIDEVGDYSIYVKENLSGIFGIKIKNHLTKYVLATKDGGSVLYFHEKLGDSLKMYNVIYVEVL